VLLALRISSFAVIDAAEVEFGPGLTVLTGETGAGKSILVDALGLLLGGRADPELIRSGCDEAVVEGVFDRTAELGARLVELGVPDLGEEVSVRRVIGACGRGKAYVNGSMVTVGILGRVLRGEVDIAGQHEHVSLFDPSRHRALLDRLGECEGPLSEYRQAFAALREVVRRIDELGGDESKVKERLELLRAQCDDIARVEPRPGEDAALEEERKRLSSAEKIRRAVAEAEAVLGTQESSAADLLGRGAALLADAVRFDGRLAPLSSRTAALRSEADELARDLSHHLELVDGDPQRLAEVDDRLDAIRRLCRRHACDLAGLLERERQLREELCALEGRRERLAALEVERASKQRAAEAAAGKLTRVRRQAAERLGGAVGAALAELAMAKAVLEVRLSRAPSLGPDGMDEVEFLFSANPGEPVRPLSRVASGGEASRLLLALKRALAGSDRCGTYVLDEADAGVSGAVADVVGRMIKDVSRDRQVLCVTHLPQVAAHADHHLVVEKRLFRGRTVSEVRPLAEGDARTQEVARMLSGVEVTAEAIGAAEALFRAARKPHAPPARSRRGAPSAGDRARKAG